MIQGESQYSPTEGGCAPLKGGTAVLPRRAASLLLQYTRERAEGVLIERVELAGQGKGHVTLGTVATVL